MEHELNLVSLTWYWLQLASPGQILSCLPSLFWCPGLLGFPFPTLVSLPPSASGGDLNVDGVLELYAQMLSDRGRA